MLNIKHLPSGVGNGFTLIELLVSVTIIGILSAIMIGYVGGNLMKQARDSRRRSDMGTLQTAFEQYYSSNNSYADCATMAVELQSGLPVAPGILGYSYDWECDSSGYCACAGLEKSGSGNASGKTGTSCSFITSGDYYCVTNLQ